MDLLVPRTEGGYFATIASDSQPYARHSIDCICIAWQEVGKRPPPKGGDRFTYSGFGPTVIWTKSVGRSHLAKVSLI